MIGPIINYTHIDNWRQLLKISNRNIPMSEDFRTVNLIEFAPAQLKREGNKLQGVLLCGLKSKNGRTYSPTVLGAATGLYEGKPVYIDHGKGQARSADDRWGTISNVAISPQGLRGDVDYLESHPFTPRVLEQAKPDAPPMFGMSHEVQGKISKQKDGSVVVESITDVAAVALVSEPATTISLNESVDTFPVIVEVVEEKVIEDQDLTEQVRSLTEANATLNELNTTLTEQVKSLTEQLTGLNEQLTSLKEEITRLNNLRWTAPRTAPNPGQTLTHESFLKTVLGKR